MNPSSYEKSVLVTESKDIPPILNRIDFTMVRLLHAGLGMSSELSELIDAYAGKNSSEPDWVNVAEESSDILWYCAVAVNTLGLNHEEVSSFESSAADHPQVREHSLTALEAAVAALTCSVGDYNDLLKKHLFYGRTPDIEKMKQSLQQICMAISGICIVSGTTIAEARQTNINKLRARYGDKFSEFDALNRDLETERKILEDGLK